MTSGSSLEKVGCRGRLEASTVFRSVLEPSRLLLIVP
jgi:hypothetical protein